MTASPQARRRKSKYKVLIALLSLVSGVYAALFYAATKAGTPIATRLIEVAQAKTIAYEAQGADGMRQVFFKAVLCNWMVTMGVVMAMTSTSTAGKIVAMWLPVTTFFVQGFEHAVVNMFVIPAGMLYGADVSVSDWLLWNQLPVNEPPPKRRLLRKSPLRPVAAKNATS